jgi:hypothetical protein
MLRFLRLRLRLIVIVIIAAAVALLPASFAFALAADVGWSGCRTGAACTRSLVDVRFGFALLAFGSST